jgi:hypothetical protein
MAEQFSLLYKVFDKKIPEFMTYIVHPDIACMMLKRHSILNMVTERVSSTENKI